MKFGRINDYTTTINMSDKRKSNVLQVLGPCKKFRPDENGKFTNYYKIICLSPEYCISQVDWKDLSKNPNATHILERHSSHIDWSELCKNPNAIHIFRKYKHLVNWRELSKNPDAIPFLEENLDEIDWFHMSANPKAIHLLEKNMDKVDFTQIYYNPSPYAVKLLYPEQTYKIKQHMSLVLTELKKYVFLPTRISRMAELYKIPFLEYLSIITGIQASHLLQFFQK